MTTKKLNPLSVLRARKLNWIPDHFTKASITVDWLSHNQLQPWVEKKLNGRYSIKYNSFEEIIMAFEDPAELTFFLLACPLIQRR